MEEQQLHHGLVFDPLPLQQGLRLVENQLNIHDVLIVFDPLPLQQGLRLVNISSNIVSFIVFDPLPLQQGLRLVCQICQLHTLGL